MANATYDTEAHAEEAEAFYGRILGDFADYFSSPPQNHLYEVI